MFRVFFPQLSSGPQIRFGKAGACCTAQASSWLEHRAIRRIVSPGGGGGGGGAVIPICEVSTQMSMHSKSYQLDACLWPSQKGHTLRFTRLYMAVAAGPGHALFRLKNN